MMLNRTVGHIFCVGLSLRKSRSNMLRKTFYARIHFLPPPVVKSFVKICSVFSRDELNCDKMSHLAALNSCVTKVGVTRCGN